MQKIKKRQKYLDLKAAWIQRFGTPPPKNLSQRLLSHALAYEEEAARYDRLSVSIKKRLLEIAGAGSAPTPTSLSTGTRLIREWNGTTYVVDVTDGGFRLGPRQFTSLSAVAKAITGAHWSGRAFFGLSRRTGKEAA